MSDLHILDFLDPVDLHKISNDAGYKEGQIGTIISIYEEEFPDIEEADIIFLGCGEQRGNALLHQSEAADVIRNEFYNLFFWHKDLKIVDAGNVKCGKTLNDSYAALKVVVRELVSMGKTVVILGGSHDLTLAQYHAFADDRLGMEAVGVDSMIDINLDSPFRNDNFLMEMLTAEPNYMQHYNHIGFQSYFVHPRMLETMDKLRFDCYRVGNVKENLEEMEPIMRDSHLLSFDIAAIAHAFAPANTATPNGFNGEEACTLMQYAGMSTNMKSIGIYGYRPEKDTDHLTAKQISHMLWYLIDGKNRGKREASLEERSDFKEYHSVFSEIETVFLQSKKTGRWWIKLPDGKFMACSYRDYMLASNNEIPERWMRVQERQ